MPELLLELFSEEIPARMQGRAADDLVRLVAEALNKAELPFDNAQAFVTPRRLALVVHGLPAAQPDVREERRGPRVDAPPKAIDGFLGSTGLTLDRCERRETPKGTFWFAMIERKGRPTAAVLAEVLPEAIAALPWPKSQRWGIHAVRWVRPLHSMICLFAGQVVPIAFGPVTAGATTRGHRFLAPASFEVANFDDYREKLRAAKVVLDAAERKEIILDGTRALAAADGLRLKEDAGLLSEVAGLVEWPVCLIGRIDDAFMDVPDEVLSTSMKSHQKYFSVVDGSGRLAPRFIVVANTEAPDGNAAIVAGNERVLRARLSDAKFFWDQDRKKALEDRLPKLADMVFHARLGTLADKVGRLERLAHWVAAFTGADADVAERAARLAKADLVSDMVFEFPEVQGIMGRYYALGGGEKPEVADAIAEHYAPQGPDDACPTKPVSVAVALADKVDTLVGFFAIDEKPTGSKDPFALRRAALGVIRLVIENRLRLPLRALFARAFAIYPAAFGERAFAKDGAAVAGELLDFFADRLKVHLKEKGVRHDLISAVFALGGEDDLVRLLARVDALQGFLTSDDGANLLVAYRRAANILRIEEKKDGVSYDGAADPALFRQDAERALDATFGAAVATCEAALKEERFDAAMVAMATLRGPVDSFFETVTVNADEPALRVNRLKSLSRIRATLNRVADFSKIEG